MNQCEIAVSIVRKGADISEGGQAKVYRATYAGGWRQMATFASSWMPIQAHLCLMKLKRIMPPSCAMALHDKRVAHMDFKILNVLRSAAFEY